MYRLKKVLGLLGERHVEFVKDVRKLYSNIRHTEYETKGKRLPASELLSLDEETWIGQYLFQLGSCLTTDIRENIIIFNMNTTKSLKETIYQAFIQGMSIEIIYLYRAYNCEILYS